MKERMAYRESKIGLLVRLDPAKASAMIREKVQAGGSLARAAVLLQVSSRSLHRWLTTLKKQGHWTDPQVT